MFALIKKSLFFQEVFSIVWNLATPTPTLTFAQDKQKKEEEKNPTEIRFHFQLFLIELDKGEKLREKPFRCQAIDEPASRGAGGGGGSPGG